MDQFALTVNLSHSVSVFSDGSLRVTPQEIFPPVTPRFRFAWDDEISDYGYKCRTQSEGFVGPDNPPAVLRFYPSARESGDYRVNLTKDPSWRWRDTIIALNGGGEEGERRFNYWVNPNTAQFNTAGWAQLAYLGMSGNRINVLERAGDWVRFETLRPQDWLRARYETEEELIHRFTCVTWKVENGVGRTVRIESTGTPRGSVYFPLVTNEGSAWIPIRFVKEL